MEGMPELAAGGRIKPTPTETQKNDPTTFRHRRAAVVVGTRRIHSAYLGDVKTTLLFFRRSCQSFSLRASFS